MKQIVLEAAPWKPENAEQAKGFWAEYQKQHDLSGRIGQAAGIDPDTGEVWFGDSALDIADRLEAEGRFRPLFYVRVGDTHYQRKGRRR